MYEGSSTSELTELLKMLSQRHRSFGNKVDYVADANRIRYTSNQKPTSLQFNPEGTMTRRTLVDVFGKTIYMDYSFYSFPGW